MLQFTQLQLYIDLAESRSIRWALTKRFAKYRSTPLPTLRLFTAHCSLFTVHCSLLTVHCFNRFQDSRIVKAYASHASALNFKTVLFQDSNNV